MGKTSRWMKALFGGGKKEKKNANDCNGGEEKKRWSFGKSRKDKGNSSPAIAVVEIQKESEAFRRRRRDFYLENEEQSKHAIALAAATAAVADAAVITAQAAVAVVKLTSYGGRRCSTTASSDSWAAVKIQCFFRGYLARKALRALKSLVKLQALVRGYLIRKRLAITIQTMQALLRAKSKVRSRRSHLIPVRDQTRFHPEIRRRRSVEKPEDVKSENSSSFRGRRLSTITTTTTTTTTSAAAAATSMDASSLSSSDDSSRVVEVDSVRPKSRTKHFSSSAEDSSSAEKQDAFFGRTTPIYRCSVSEDCRFSTTQNTPRFPSLEASRKINWNPLYSPNYMANTLSSRAKVRSHSAPKQRMEGRRRELAMDAVDQRVGTVTTNTDRRLSCCSSTSYGHDSSVKKMIF